MKRHRSRSAPCRRVATQPRGSTLLIVVALMGMLAFLGFVFYTFAAQERANALAFSEDAKSASSSMSQDPEALFDFALQQVILGTDDTFRQSILWGGRHTILANMYGRDRIPFNGEGVNLMQTPAGQPQVDMNFNGSSADANDNQNLLDIVDSPVANPGVWTYGASGVLWGTNKRFRGTGSLDMNRDLPEPDVNYNSPDINSVWLSYDGTAVDGTGSTARRVIIPSYFRPQYLRTGGASIANWYTNASASQVMRPHPGHVCVDSLGNAITVGGSNVRRFVDATEMDTSVTPSRPRYQSLGLTRAFSSPSGSFAPKAANGTASTGRLGIWSGNSEFDIDLDVDTDGDGILDAILMDLGASPIRRGDGKLVVPLFAISIRDLNGLLNVNATGNLAGNLNFNSLSSANQLGFRQTGVGTYVADSLAKSDQGLSTYEINFSRALTANPTDSLLTSSDAGLQLTHYLRQFDPTVVTPGRSISELANLEWLLLNIGRAQFHLSQAQVASTAAQLRDAINGQYSGRFGELSRMRNFLTTQNFIDLPRAGQSVASFIPPTWLPISADDNGNFNEGESVYAARWVHPLDFLGSGQQFQRYDHGLDAQPGVASVDDDGNGVVDDFSEEGWVGSDDTTIRRGKAREFLRNGANLWPAYSGFHSFNGSATGGVRWGEIDTTGATYSAQLMTNSRWYSLLDDPTESIIDQTLLSPDYSQAATLSTTKTSDSVFGAGELPFLMGHETDIRNSNLRSRVAELMPGNLVASSTAPDIRKRLTTVSSDRREYGFGTSVVGDVRSWEMTPQFPPGLSAAGTDNPYRNDLFRLLRQQGSAGVNNWQMRLNVNRLLTTVGGPGTQLQFRALADHAPASVMTAAANVTAHNERQLMARDIYTLLYTLCQGSATDYRTAAAPTAEQTREMAQFAVNLVDELDTDDIITAFYFDPDLSEMVGGGWTAAAATEVVYGVERQLLAFSESLAIRVNREATDSNMTIFDDAATDPANGRRYVFFELQNVTPMNVALATTASVDANSSTWRVTLQDGADVAKSRVHFLSGLNNSYSTIQADLTLPPATLFTVGSQDGSDTCSGGYRTSDFRADINDPFDGGFDRIVPSGGTADNFGSTTSPPTGSTAQNQFPTPKCDLDLVWDGAGYPTNAFVLETSPTTPGSFAGALDAATMTFRLVLERRASDGTFQAVDQTAIQNVAVVAPPAMSTGVTAALAGVISQERRTPLSRKSETAATAAAPRRNTFKTANGDSNATLWQHHNDRDFASLADLFQIPLYGPERLTDGRLGDREFADRTADLDASASTDPIYDATGNPTYIPVNAAARFLNPGNPDQTVAPDHKNRWYRLLEFLEVPNRSHQYATIRTQSALTTPVPTMLAEPYNLPIGFGWPRTHGQLNLNMIRHPHALAALLDDDQLIDGATMMSNVLVLNGQDEANRRWWVQFLASRDSRSTGNFAVDPVTNLYVPGTGNARPFRGFDAVGPVPSATDSPLENTLLRSLPLDGSGGGDPNSFRRLFEVGTTSEHFGTPANEVASSPLHPSARYRLLSKVLNNVTTRSNSFGVFVTVQYYEAAEQNLSGQSAPAVRIGGRLDDTPTHRGFFVVDRSGAVEQMKALSRDGIDPVSGSSYSFTADTNRTGAPNGIRWRDLVLFRQTLN